MDQTIDQVEAIKTATVGISATIGSSELATAVGHLGRWKVRDVVAHLGGVHRWAARVVRDRSMDGPSFTKSKLHGDELRAWFAEGAQELLETLRKNGRDDPCPNFNPGSRKDVAWWVRRQLHETTVHRWDIESALIVPTPIDPFLAADGVDEFLDVFVRTRGKQTLTGSLILTSDQPFRSWTLTQADKPGRLDVTSGRVPGVTTELVGSPQDLLLYAWGRMRLADTELQVVGDAEIALSLSRSS